MKNDPKEVRHTKQAITQFQVCVAMLQSLDSMLRESNYEGDLDPHAMQRCLTDGFEKVHAIMSAMPHEELLDQYACMLQARVVDGIEKPLILLSITGKLRDGLPELNAKCEQELVTLERKLVELQTA